MQPLWGLSYGKNDQKSLRYYFKAAFIINLAASVVIVLLLTLFSEQAIMIFNNEPELIASGSKALPVFAVSFIPMAANLIIAGYFFSVQRTFQANVISMSRGVVLKAIAILTVPMLFGQSVIWLSPLVAELITAGMAGVILLLECKKNRTTNKI